MTAIEQKLDQMALRSELKELKARIESLEEKTVLDNETARAELDELKGRAETLRGRIEQLERQAEV